MNASTTTIAEMTCLGCACLCDDVTVQLNGTTPLFFGVSCHRGESWLQSAFAAATELGDSRACHVDGKPTPLAIGIDAAVRILTRARRPMVCGLNSVDTEAMRAAISVADWIGAIVDASHPDYLSATLAMQQFGMATATLGEIQRRADVVLFWGTDPLATAPRHLERYSRTPHIADRTCYVIDAHETLTAQQSDEFIQVPNAANFEAIAVIRSILKGTPIDPSRIQSVTGQGLAIWQHLSARLQAARYGAIFFGAGITAGVDGLANSESLLQLTRELNKFARFACFLNRPTAYSAAAENVLTWRTGFPAAVSLAAGFPQYNPYDWTADRALSRGEVDAALCVGDIDQIALSSAAESQLGKIPWISLSPRPNLAADVSFQVAWPGIHHAATLDRMDNVPIHAAAIVRSSLPTAASLLWQLDHRLQPSGSDR